MTKAKEYTTKPAIGNYHVTTVYESPGGKVLGKGAGRTKSESRLNAIINTSKWNKK